MSDYIGCSKCKHEKVCKAWYRELISAEECYAQTDYVTIYDRHSIGGDGCENFEED